MVTLMITLDTQTFAKEDFDVLLQDGILLKVIGLVNHRWEEFSAVQTANRFGLRPVFWEETWDDTPGNLTCHFGYWDQTKAQIQCRIFGMDGIDHQELYSLD